MQSESFVQSKSQNSVSTDLRNENARSNSDMGNADQSYVPVSNGSPLSKHRYPHSIVWTPLSIISWIFPFIGHTGICQENGLIRDFQGPYTIGEGQMAFGNPTKYWQLNVRKIKGAGVTWDSAVRDSCEEYKNRMHILCWDNCHSHVAYALNRMQYNGHSSYNMFSICFLMLLFGKYTSFKGFVITWLPFAIVCAIITAIVLGTKYAS